MDGSKDTPSQHEAHPASMTARHGTAPRPPSSQARAHLVVKVPCSSMKRQVASCATLTTRRPSASLSTRR